MVDWSNAGGFAAVVSALYLPFILSPTASAYLYRAGRSVVKLIWPTSALCETLFWDDVPDGNLHECNNCTGRTNTRLHLAHHDKGTECWREMLANAFSRAWILPGRRQRLVPKPTTLELKQKYLCTDAKTVLAFILCAMKSNDRVGVHDRDDHRFGGCTVSANGHNGTVIAHLTGSVQRNSTKATIEGILAGYPPWYRETLVISHGPVIPHPIKSRDDIFRAGWVVGVGLSEQEPLPWTPRNEIFSITASTFADKPIKRVLGILEQKLKPHFPDDVHLEAACRAVAYLIRAKTVSGVERYLRAQAISGVERYLTEELDLENDVRDSINQLSGHQCIFAMALFNDFKPLTEEERCELAPILFPIVHVAFTGAYKVVQHLKNGGYTFLVPGVLQDPHRRVYITGCCQNDG